MDDLVISVPELERLIGSLTLKCLALEKTVRNLQNRNIELEEKLKEINAGEKSDSIH